jgi:hypothetical protein
MKNSIDHFRSDKEIYETCTKEILSGSLTNNRQMRNKIIPIYPD